MTTTASGKPLDTLVGIANNLQKHEDGVYFYKRISKNEYIQDFVCIFMRNLKYLIETYKLTLREIRILVALASEVQFGNKISIKQKYLATDLGMYPSDVSKAIKRLKDVEILIQIDEEWYLNPQLLAKGKIDHYVVETSCNTSIPTAVKAGTE